MNEENHVKAIATLQERIAARDLLLVERHTALKELIETKFEAIKEATDKALKSNDKRLEGMNEFRDSLKDQTKLYATRIEHNLIIDRLGIIDKKLAFAEGKASQMSVFITMGIALISLMIALIDLTLKFIK
jgi:hypothetical protein